VATHNDTVDAKVPAELAHSSTTQWTQTPPKPHQKTPLKPPYNHLTTALQPPDLQVATYNDIVDAKDLAELAHSGQALNARLARHQVCVSFLPASCHLPASFLPPCCHLAATFLPASCHLPASFLPPSCHLPATFQEGADAINDEERLFGWVWLLRCGCLK
jgi:hypothetical protein